MHWQKLAQKIGKNILTLRKSKGLTQEKAAELSGSLSVRHWQYLENGEVNCTIDSICKIAKALGVEPRDLLL